MSLDRIRQEKNKLHSRGLLL
uniref:Uncharacterized protein n=1 Tax=Arundo donax TaxID=35708 RepID=A0A0A9G1J9_ARUDO